MMFVSNHDKNAWEGTEYEQFGDALEAAIVLSVVGQGMPLIYNGQEAGSDKRLPFFEKDPIVWRDHPMADFYRRLFALKRDTSALWNARWGATMINVPNEDPAKVLSFVRQDETSKVFVVLNLSEAPRTVGVRRDALPRPVHRLLRRARPIDLDEATTLTLPPWGYRVFVR